MELIATCTFGLEKLIREELKALNLTATKTEDGRVTFEGDEKSIIKANKNLRCASRIGIKMGEFKAITFDELFDQISQIEWEKYIGQNDKFPVAATSTKSVLHSEPAIQSIVKKAIVKRLQKAYKEETLPENSEATYQIMIKANKDQFIASIDTSGESLHKRGYRSKTIEAPIKETLAASMVKFSDWPPAQASTTTPKQTQTSTSANQSTEPNQRFLIDPFCGSGTILIEAALIARNLPPAQERPFAFQKWPWMSEFLDEKPSKSKNKKTTPETPKLFGFDIDEYAIKVAKENAKRAGVDDMIIFRTTDFNNLDFHNFENATFITNPPYGERIEESAAVTKLYQQLGEKFRQTKSCSLFLITSREDFPRLFGKKENKNRKLFNGNLKCYLYSY